MKSYLLTPRNIFLKIMKIADVFNDDKVSVYAAQASFFIIISAIPFIMLLISLVKYVIPIEEIDIAFAIENLAGGSFGNLIGDIIDELFSRPAITLLSISALTTLWSASKGVTAVGRGIRNVYGVNGSGNFFIEIIRSVVYTIIFILILIVSFVVLLFGRELSYALSEKYIAVSRVLDFLVRCRLVIFSAVLTMFFSLMYNALAKTKPRQMRFKDQLPGAVVAAFGWILYSFFYSLYIRYFPSASYIYGSLAAVVLLMLWLYFCMMILLVGAEINKYLIFVRSSTKSDGAK